MINPFLYHLTWIKPITKSPSDWSIAIWAYFNSSKVLNPSSTIIKIPSRWSSVNSIGWVNNTGAFSHIFWKYWESLIAFTIFDTCGCSLAILVIFQFMFVGRLSIVKTGACTLSPGTSFSSLESKAKYIFASSCSEILKNFLIVHP